MLWSQKDTCLCLLSLGHFLVEGSGEEWLGGLWWLTIPHCVNWCCFTKGPLWRVVAQREGTGSRLGDREVWVRGAWVWGLELQWLAQSRGVYGCSADGAGAWRVHTCDRSPVQLQSKTYTLLPHSHQPLHISTHISLRGEQRYENSFLIRAVVSWFIFCIPENPMPLLWNWGLKLLVQLFPEFEIFCRLSFSDSSSRTRVVYSRSVYTDRSLCSPKVIAPPPSLFSVALLSPLTSILRLNLSPLNKPLSFLHVWEWQGSQVKLMPVSQSSLKQAQALAQLSPRLICLSFCQARLLPWPLTPVSRALRWWTNLKPPA